MKELLQLCIFFVVLNLSAQEAGALDTSFGDQGKVITSVNNGTDKGYSIALQSDGKILIAGQTYSNNTGNDFVLLRYTENGVLDSSFGSNGYITTDIQLGSDDIAYSMVLQDDGKIILGGFSDDGSLKQAALVRYNNDGTLDASFGVNGIVLTPFEGNQSSEIKKVKVHELTGNIIVGGNTQINSAKAKPVVARYTSNGLLDTSFNTTGIRLLWIDNLDSQYFMTVEDLQIKSNGKISAVGWRDFPSMSWSNDFWACRINSDGSMDSTFSTDGVNVYNGGFNGNDKAFSLLLKPDNTLIVAGSSDTSAQNYAMVLFEVDPSGSASSTNQESVSFGALDKSFAYSLAEDINGDYVIAGSTGDNTSKSFAIARITSDFNNDVSFSNDGKVETTFNSNQLNEAYDIAIQSDNKIIAVGYSGNDIAIARYLGEENLNVRDQQSISFKIHPNPTSENISIELNNISDNIDYLISDVNGRVLIQNTLNDNRQINLDFLESGIYFIKLTNKNSSETKKIIKK